MRAASGRGRTFSYYTDEFMNSKFTHRSDFFRKKRTKEYSVVNVRWRVQFSSQIHLIFSQCLYDYRCLESTHHHHHSQRRLESTAAIEQKVARLQSTHHRSHCYLQRCSQRRRLFSYARVDLLRRSR
ncbi:hypothetical protein B0H12DRAFT_1092415 [Mycena haematopus]|nr:hypothetical protein B0H12DRAFT_1092415 [Mycena haematopus]